MVWAILVLVATSACEKVSGATPDTRSPTATTKVLQINLCGNENSAPNGCKGRRSLSNVAIAKAIADEITRTGADTVTLNEACRGQVDALVALLRESGSSAEAAFAASVVAEGLACSGPKEYGNAVLSLRGSLGPARTYRLATSESPEDHVERRNLICATNTVGLTRRSICSTHLMPRAWLPGEHDRQLQNLMDALHQEGKSADTVVLGGDLNAEPETIRKVVEGSGFVDAARWSGPPTYGKHRYDYVLASLPAAPRTRTMQVAPLPFTDHNAIMVELNWQHPEGSSAEQRLRALGRAARTSATD